MSKQTKPLISSSLLEPVLKPVTQVVSQLRNTVATFWGQRNKREQNMLSVAIVVVLAALIYLILLAPAIEGRQRLQKSLPGLRQQAAELQQIIAQTGNLNQASDQAATPISQSGVEAALKRLGMSSKSILVTGNNAKVQFTAISFSGLINFLQQVQATEHWQVIEAKVNAVEPAKPGIVDASVTLNQKNSE
ncbi:type II secretion system protein GspM [Glaciimonas soli]|nr:type II secretion system protein GspM [Glaciimonas soli]